MADPLWLQLRNHPSLFCVHPTPQQLATMLECIASEVERRGDIDYDRDPGETAEWLRAEAKTAREVVYGDAARATAWDAADAVWDAARAAARANQRDLLLRLITDAPVVDGTTSPSENV